VAASKFVETFSLQALTQIDGAIDYK